MTHDSTPVNDKITTASLLAEGFEGGNFPSTWTVGKSNATSPVCYWAPVASGFAQQTPHAGGSMVYCAAVGYAGSAEAPYYRKNMSAYMQRSINLSGLTSAQLTFWYLIPALYVNHASCSVYIDSTQVWSYSWEIAPWQQASINLTPYVGATRTLKFCYTSDSTIDYPGGCFLDDIHVIGAVSGGPEIHVKNGAVEIANGGGPVNFGSTVRGGAALARTFTILNSGESSLNLSNLIVPDPYIITLGIPSSIAAGASGTFIITLPATKLGTHPGTISFATNQINKNPFRFSVTGKVTLPLPTQPHNLPVLHVELDRPSTIPGGGTVTYTYQWTSSRGATITHSKKTATEDILREKDTQTTFRAGDVWTVTVTPYNAENAPGPSVVGRFIFGPQNNVTFQGWTNYP